MKRRKKKTTNSPSIHSYCSSIHASHKICTIHPVADRYCFVRREKYGFSGVQLLRSATPAPFNRTAFDGGARDPFSLRTPDRLVHGFV